jgi:deoxycytidylate deaminase
MEISKAHRAYFAAARAMSKMSDFPRVAVGAVAVYGHRIISSGFNSCKSDPVQKQYNKYRFSEDTPASIHAEVMALKGLINRDDIDFKNVSLYVYRECKNGDPALSRPCPSCMQLITDLGIRHIYYTNNGGFSHEEIFH